SVVAYDAATNASLASGTAGITPADTTSPGPPSGLSATLVGTDGAHLTWTASTDNVGVTDYVITRNGGATVTFHAGTALSYDDTSVVVGASYSYTVVAYDAASNASAPSNAAAWAPADTTPPSVPTNLAATQGVSSGVHL